MQESQLISEEQTYSYADLPEQGKERARQLYVEKWIYDDWYDYIFEDAKDGGSVKGFEIEDIFFSGFWSQGDGAMWTGGVDIPKFIEHYFPESIGRECWLWLLEDGWLDSRVSIHRSSHHYSHSNCMGITGTEPAHYDEDDTLRVDSILKGAPIATLYNLIVADTACPIKDISDLEEMILDKARDYADMIYDSLREGYERETSDESIGDVYDANNVLFNDEGEVI